MNAEVWRTRQRLDHLFGRVGDVDDLELQAHWARYLCVLTSGFLEVAVRALLGEYAAQKSSQDVAKFVKGRLKTFQSANMNNIYDLTREFSSEWAEELEAQTAGALKDAVDSIVANRHQIAHGQDVGISYAVISDYYSRAIKVVDLIRLRCDP